MQSDWSENLRVPKRGAEPTSGDGLVFGALEPCDLEMLLDELAELIEMEGGILTP